MLNRQLSVQLLDEVRYNPAVALLGPRQVGKTTLALELARQLPHLYLDLESERDRARLSQPELYLAAHLDKLVILDEVHRSPALFPVLRGLIDQARRQGLRAGQYLLLGSASLDLLKQSGESLAGRIAYLELSPLLVTETGPELQERLWLRGGFPESLLAPDDARSLRWRHNFIRTYLERDIPWFSPRIASEKLRRFWTLLAHAQGGLLNGAQLARHLGVDVKTAHAYLDLLCALLLVRRLPPWHTNVGKRLVKSPKVYVRDSGILHALLDIGTTDALLAHMVMGASWEGFAIENLLACAAPRAQGYFYRTGAGAEIDLLLHWPDGSLWAIEIKRSLAPKLERGFHAACEDLQPRRKLVIHPGTDSFPLAADITAMPLWQACQEVLATASG
ncbi:MAG: ATP-binding protein [Hylemonella sp.]